MSSFGPFGRSILLYNETTLLLTRDAQQIFSVTQQEKSRSTNSAIKPPLGSESASSLSYDAYLFKVLVNYNSQSSDGLGTLSMLLQCFLSLVSTASHRHSLELLRALELIMEIMHSYETEITKLMMDAEIWIVETDIRKYLDNIFRVVLAPALNAAVAIKMSGLL